MIILGFDPGGDNAFGWGVFRLVDASLRRLKSGTAGNAREAFMTVRENVPDDPVAIAVDTPLFWVGNGGRKADETVRRLVREAGGHASTVNAVNSLRGACLVQGVLIARYAQELWPNCRVTESHPKALYCVWGPARRFALSRQIARLGEHERDAALGAYAARQWLKRSTGWTDLAIAEPESHSPLIQPAAYWFPSTIRD